MVIVCVGSHVKDLKTVPHDAVMRGIPGRFMKCDGQFDGGVCTNHKTREVVERQGRLLVIN